MLSGIGVGVGVGVGGVGGGVVGDGVVGDGVVAVVGGGGEGAGANAVDVEVVGQTGKAFQLLGNPIRWISVIYFGGVSGRGGVGQRWWWRWCPGERRRC